MEALMKLPNTLLGNRRNPNERFNGDKKNLMNKMSEHPVKVLPNGNVLMSNGNILNGKAVHAHSNVSNMSATPAKQLGNEKLLMSNGNVINTRHHKTPSLPVRVVNNHLLMSNGNSVSPNVLKNIPQERPNPSNTSPMANSNMRRSRSPSPMGMGRLSPGSQQRHRPRSRSPILRGEYLNRSAPQFERLSNASVNSLTTMTDRCPIAAASKPLRYCRPGPFHSVNGERYFYVGEAYGAPVAE